MLLWLVIILVVLGGAFFAFQADPELAAPLMNMEAGAIIAALALAVYVVIIFSANRGPVMQTIRQLSLWAGLMLALIIGYSYREEVGIVTNRVVGNLMPPGAGVTVETGNSGERAVRIRKRRDGHYAATATVNGRTMTLMLDTGASTVVLKPADAVNAGIDVANLSYSMAVRTANGTTYAAPVRLDQISIGPIVITDVEALVAKPGNLNESLLGMSFLRRLRSFDFSGEYVTLRG